MNELNNNVFDELIVVKRSGQRVNFNSNKIAIAIKKAFDSVFEGDSIKQINKIYEDVLMHIEKNYVGRKTINVEDVQDIIENKIKENNCENVYKSFSEYRDRRAASRKAFSMKQQHKFVKAIERIVNDNKEDVNSVTKPNEMLLDFGKTISCEYTKAYILDNKFVRAHEEGSIYIHNLDYFNLGSLSSTHLMFESAIDEDFPSKLLMLAMNAKNEIDGEISISSIDYLLIDFVLKKFREVYKKTINKYLEISFYKDYINLKKIEEIIDKENSVDINQNVFSQYVLNGKVKDIFQQAYVDSINDLEEELNRIFKNMLLTLNNNYHENKKYSISLGTNNSFEGLMIINCYLKQIENLSKLENVTTIFKIKKESNREIINKITDLIFQDKNIALSNVSATYNKGLENEVEYFSNGRRIFENIFSEEKSSLGRMIVSSCSINVGRLGFKYANKDMDNFYKELKELLEITKNILVMIFETIGNKNKENYQIIFNENILEDEKLEHGQKIRKIIKKGALNIELVGLKECVMNLCDGEEMQKKLVSDILDFINEQIKKYTEEVKLNFILSETSKYRPLKKLIAFDKAIYGIKKDITDKDSYCRIDSLFSYGNELEKDLEYIGKYQSQLSGGNLVSIALSKSDTNKKVLKIIEMMLEFNVGFLKFEMRK